MLFRWPSLLLVFLLVSASAAAQDGISKLSIHGYLSQAYAKSDGNQILGVDSEGTTDYRTAALLLRYEMSDFDSFVVQLSNERLGESPFGALREDVTFDWLFYERKIGGSTALRVGKVPNPFGIYAELRDVGILLPFYRPPNSIYQEFFLSETIDGVSVSRDFHGESPWSIDTDFYFGQASESEATLIPIDYNNTYGFRVWLNTPIRGVRVGMSGSLSEVSAVVYGDHFDAWIASLEIARDRFVLRSEYEDLSFDDLAFVAYYGQLIFRLSEKFSLNLQAEWGDLEIVAPFLGRVPIDFDQDYALGVNYSFRPDVVLKVEHHWNEGFSAEGLPEGYIFAGSPLKTSILIVTLAVGF